MTQTDATRASSDKIVIFDTTLRDGEQCPGATMTFEDKIELAELLDEMGVDIIEAGFPIASEGDFEAVSEIARRVSRALPGRPRTPRSPASPAPSRATSPAAARRCATPASRASTPSSRPRRSTWPTR